MTNSIDGSPKYKSIQNNYKEYLVGEDGPTYESIEQLASLRAMPNVHVIRSAYEIETHAVWKTAIISREPPTVTFFYPHYSLSSHS
ncbi:hypothetical protein KGF86_18930 [Ornithinibacillus massiliensis]|uniref:Transketolase-like pyrimidine-binding domain-containing protein n=1 Tax=Ornithinibacillus massiliensis TaxID=1944633 RepID=A0ABS5MIV1_9BACI|nr:hypothetical protein [Ornithinibacillus massiliensis]